MKTNRLIHYARRYRNVVTDVSFKEANKKVFNITATHFLNRIMGILNSNGENMDTSRKMLFIESTDEINGWGLGDGIFKTGLLSDIWSSGIELDVAAHSSRQSIFKNNPHISNLYETNSLKRNIELSRVLKSNSYESILLIFPNWEMMLLALLSSDKSKIYFEKREYDYPKTVNHIEMYRNIAAKNIPNLEAGNGQTLISLTKGENDLARHIVGRKVGKTYVGINIGAKCSLRNFKNWMEVVSTLYDRFGNKVVFVLYGRENTFGLDKEIEKKIPGVLNLVSKTPDLRMLYAVMNEMDLNIGADGGNINASIAMGKNTLPIYTVVNGDGRVPGVFPKENIIQGKCINGQCFGTSFGMTCEITKQRSDCHNDTPPCLTSAFLIDEIVFKAGRIIESNV